MVSYYYKNRMYLKNNEGYSLGSVLIINLAINSILFGFVILISYYSLFDTIKIKKTKLDFVCESVLNKEIIDSETIHEEGVIAVEDSQQVIIRKDIKGLYQSIEASARNGNFKSSLKYITGIRFVDVFKSALIITKPNFRGAVTGNSKITGDILTTKKKIIPGRIIGVNRVDHNFHSGELIENEDLNPKLFNETLLTNWFKKISTHSRQETSIRGDFVLTSSTLSQLSEDTITCIGGELIISDSLSGGRFQKSIKLFADDGIRIESGAVIQVPLILFTDSTITVSGGAQIDDVIFCSSGPVTIGSNALFKKTQMFSKKNISITGATFLYPSVLAMYVDMGIPENHDNEIKLTSTKFNGVVALISSEVGLGSNKSKIILNEGSKVQGLVYSENQVYAECNVLGCLYTYELFYYKEPTEYKNWLVNTQINRNDLDTNFVIPYGFNISSSTKIIEKEWLD